MYHISGAGIYAASAAPQYDDHPIANNGLILSAISDISVGFMSNSSQTGVGAITVPDGRTQSNGGNVGVWQVATPLSRPGVFFIFTSISLPSTSQGIYTATIPDSNNNMLTFNVGLYPNGFDGELLL